MAILKGAEAEAWLKANPNKAYKNLSTGQYVDRKRGLLEQLALKLSRPFRTFIPAAQELTRTMGALGQGLATGEVSRPGPMDYLGLTKEESKNFYENPLTEGTKAGIGLMSYGLPAKLGMPVGAAEGTKGLGAMFSAGKSMVLPSAMQGLALSDPGEELKDTLTSAGTGFILGGALEGLSQASKAIKLNQLQKKLATSADDFEVSNYVKKIGGKPTMQQGKMNLARESKAYADLFKRPINNADDLAAFSDDLLSEFGGTADNYAAELSELGVKIDIEDVLTPLKKQLASTKTEALKKPIQQVINEVRAAAGKTRMIDPVDALALRREWGALGNWNQFTPASEQAVASAWNDVYMRMNDVLDDAFQGVGMSGFRETNKILNTAILQKNWARRAIATANQAPVWTDMAQDAVAFAGGSLLGGGVPGGLAGFLGSKFLQANGNKIAGGAMKGASNLLGTLSGAGGAVSSVAGAITPAVPAIAGLLGSGSLNGGLSEPQGASENVDIPQDFQQGGFGANKENLVLAQLVMSGQLTVSEAKYIAQLLGLGGTGDVSKLSTAIDELERLYGAGTAESLSVGEKTTGLSGLFNKAVATGKGAFDQEFADRKTAYEQQRAIAVGIINKAREAGVLNEGEYQVMVANMPNEYTSDKAAQDWFYNVRRMLLSKGETQGGDTQSVSALYDMLGL